MKAMHIRTFMYMKHLAEIQSYVDNKIEVNTMWLKFIDVGLILNFVANIHVMLKERHFYSILCT